MTDELSTCIFYSRENTKKTVTMDKRVGSLIECLCLTFLNTFMTDNVADVIFLNDAGYSKIDSYLFCTFP